MITKMTKYNFVLMNSGKEEFLEQIRELGVVDITRSVKPVDGKSEDMMERISRIKSALAAVEKVDWSADPDAPQQHPRPPAKETWFPSSLPQKLPSPPLRPN